MSRALVAAALSQGQPRTALQLFADGLRAASTLPVAEQLELAIGVAEEAAIGAKDFLAARVLRAGARD
jgi:hypothetical protein